jgi:hypothetical protein
MSKFNAVVLKAQDGTQVHFVTRGKSKKPTMDEVIDYMNENNIILANLESEIKEEAWKPSNGRVFLSDLRFGLEFCSNKYGVSKSSIEKYITDNAPHINVEYYNRKDGDG